jgi:hypothetical protein
MQSHLCTRVIDESLAHGTGELDGFADRALRELRTSAVCVSVHAALLEGDLAAEAPPRELREIARQVRRQAVVLAQLIDDFLQADTD